MATFIERNSDPDPRVHCLEAVIHCVRIMRQCILKHTQNLKWFKRSCDCIEFGSKNLSQTIEHGVILPETSLPKEKYGIYHCVWEGNEPVSPSLAHIIEFDVGWALSCLGDALDCGKEIALNGLSDIDGQGWCVEEASKIWNQASSMMYALRFADRIAIPSKKVGLSS